MQRTRMPESAATCHHGLCRAVRPACPRQSQDNSAPSELAVCLHRVLGKAAPTPQVCGDRGPRILLCISPSSAFSGVVSYGGCITTAERQGAVEA